MRSSRTASPLRPDASLCYRSPPGGITHFLAYLPTSTPSLQLYFTSLFTCGYYHALFPTLLPYSVDGLCSSVYAQLKNCLSTAARCFSLLALLGGCRTAVGSQDAQAAVLLLL